MFTPGADGALAMAAARSRRAGDPLLVIDQFEEAFTLADATFARPWLDDFARYARERAPVVLVVRGDHVADARRGRRAGPARGARPPPGRPARRGSAA